MDTLVGFASLLRLLCMGEAHVSILWGKFFAKSEESLRAYVVTAKGVKRQSHSTSFSVVSEFKYGQVKLLFREDCSKKDFENAVHQFVDLMYSYSSGEQNEDSIDLDNEPDCVAGFLTLEYDGKKNRLQFLNPLSNQGDEFVEQMRRLERERRKRIRGSRHNKRIEPTVGEKPPDQTGS